MYTQKIIEKSHEPKKHRVLVGLGGYLYYEDKAIINSLQNVLSFLCEFDENKDGFFGSATYSMTRLLKKINKFFKRKFLSTFPP